MKDKHNERGRLPGVVYRPCKWCDGNFQNCRENHRAASSTRPRSTKKGSARNAVRKTAKAKGFEGRVFDLRRAEVLDISLRAAHYELQFGQRSIRKEWIISKRILICTLKRDARHANALITKWGCALRHSYLDWTAGNERGLERQDQCCAGIFQCLEMALRKDVLEDVDPFTNQVSKDRNWLIKRGEAEPPKARTIWPAEKKAVQASITSKTAGSLA